MELVDLYWALPLGVALSAVITASPFLLARALGIDLFNFLD